MDTSNQTMRVLRAIIISWPTALRVR